MAIVRLVNFFNHKMLQKILLHLSRIFAIDINVKRSDYMSEEDLEFLRNHPELSYAEAAARIGLSKQRVWQICRKHGIKLTAYAKIPRDGHPSHKSNGQGPFVYVVGESPAGPCKIGITYSPITRLNDLQGGNYRELKIFSLTKVDGWRSAWHTGAKTHRRLANVIMRSSEWFCCTSAEALSAIELSLTDSHSICEIGLRKSPLSREVDKRIFLGDSPPKETGGSDVHMAMMRSKKRLKPSTK